MSTNSTIQETSTFEDPIFYEFLVALFFYVPSFFFQLALLIQIQVHRLARDLSANLLINIVCWALILGLGLCNGLYMLLNLESSHKSSYFLLIIGGAFASSALALSISVLFMTLDRIFALSMPMKHKIHQRSFVVLTVCCCVAVFLLTMLLTVVFMPSLSFYTSCKTLVCLVSHRFLVIFGCAYLLISLLNIIASIAFNVALYKYWNRTQVDRANRENFRQANYFVLVSCLTEVLFRIFPQILKIILSSIGVPAIYHEGLVSTTAGVDALVNALIYRYLIMKRVKMKTSTKVLSVTRLSTNF